MTLVLEMFIIYIMIQCFSKILPFLFKSIRLSLSLSIHGNGILSKAKGTPRHSSTLSHLPLFRPPLSLRGRRPRPPPALQPPEGVDSSRNKVVLSLQHRQFLHPRTQLKPLLCHIRRSARLLRQDRQGEAGVRQGEWGFRHPGEEILHLGLRHRHGSRREERHDRISCRRPLEELACCRFSRDP